MEYRFEFRKARIYINSQKKSLAAIQKETGCDVIINGGLYNMAKFTPVCHLKADGKVYAADQYKYLGYGWNSADTKLQMVIDYGDLDNYICCMALVKDGKKTTVQNNSALGGKRGRTAIGTLPDGKTVIFCSKDGTSDAMTPVALQKHCMDNGWKEAVMLDSGGSSQCITPEGKITSTRKVHNVLCFWLKKETIGDKGGMMTMADSQKVIDIALAEVGYLEKATNSQLDSKTDNAGKGNWTKYARDLDLIPGFYNGKKNGYSWCDVFIDWCFVQAYGVETAKKLLLQPDKSLGAGCTYSARYFKNAGQLHTSNPQPGDQIFFGTASRCTHTGLVYKVDDSKVYTVEGNTSGASGVVANGGGVKAKSYALTYSKIYGYGRPAYDGNTVKAQVEIQTTAIDTVEEVQLWLNQNYASGLTLDGLYGSLTKKALVKALQKNLGVAVDGSFGPKTKAAVKALRKGDKGALVRILQCFLVCNKHKITVDGSFGGATQAAVKAYQKAHKLEVDGIAGPATFKTLCS